MEEYFFCCNNKFNRFWHCFGNKHHLAPIEMIVSFLKESKTNIIPINTHKLTKSRDRNYLEVGYAGVPFHILSQRFNTESYIKMLNINPHSTAEDAIEKTKLAYEMTGFPIIKLEVLDPTHKYSNQDAIVLATKTLIEWDTNLVIFPLFANDIVTAKRLVDIGAPLLRVMGSGIGSCAGLENIDSFQKICELGAPVILDGGIGSIEHARLAMEAGAAGILINSMLFQEAKDPVSVMHDFAIAYRKLLEEVEVSVRIS